MSKQKRERNSTYFVREKKKRRKKLEKFECEIREDKKAPKKVDGMKWFQLLVAAKRSKEKSAFDCIFSCHSVDTRNALAN